MRLTKHKRDTTAGMNITPMIDVVFLLLIFFITVSQISKINNVKLELPSQKGSEEQKKANITVNVNQDGEIIVSGNKLSIPQLVATITDELVAVDNDSSRLIVVLRGDKRGTSRTVNDIVRAGGKLGLTQVKFAVEDPGG